jgi:hypothetical protein
MPTEMPPEGTPFELALGEGTRVPAVFVAGVTDVPAAVHALGLTSAGCALVVVGGAGEMTHAEIARATQLFDEALAPLADRLQAVVIDGGTNVGVMGLMGRARERREAAFPLVGVVAADLVGLGTRADVDAALEPYHTHFLLVSGSRWGDEVPFISALASAVAPPGASVTVLVNGGTIAWRDVAASVDAGRAVIVADGSGRTADLLAAATRGETSDARAAALVQTGTVRAVDAADPQALAAVAAELLGGR